MKEATKLLIQYDDFECFSKSRTDVKTFICNISFADWVLIDNGYKFTITANRFLRNMVRAIVGTIIYIVSKKKLKNNFKKQRYKHKNYKKYHTRIILGSYVIIDNYL